MARLGCVSFGHAHTLACMTLHSMRSAVSKNTDQSVLQMSGIHEIFILYNDN